MYEFFTDSKHKNPNRKLYKGHEEVIYKRNTNDIYLRSFLKSSQNANKGIKVDNTEAQEKEPWKKAYKRANVGTPGWFSGWRVRLLILGL